MDLQSFLADIEFALKRNLKVGENLNHRHLGPVVFTDGCAEMEKRSGMTSTLYVEHEGDIKEITLTLVERDTDDGRVLRMQEFTTELEREMAKAHEFIETQEIRPAAPFIDALKTHLRNLH